MKFKTEKEQLAAVKNHGWTIYYIDDPSMEVQLAAVREDGWAIYYIDDPSQVVKDFIEL